MQITRQPDLPDTCKVDKAKCWCKPTSLDLNVVMPSRYKKCVFLMEDLADRLVIEAILKHFVLHFYEKFRVIL